MLELGSTSVKRNLLLQAPLLVLAAYALQTCVGSTGLQADTQTAHVTGGGRLRPGV